MKAADRARVAQERSAQLKKEDVERAAAKILEKQEEAARWVTRVAVITGVVAEEGGGARNPCPRLIGGKRLILTADSACYLQAQGVCTDVEASASLNRAVDRSTKGSTVSKTWSLPYRGFQSGFSTAL